MNQSDRLKVMVSNRSKLRKNIKVLDQLIKDFDDSEFVQDNLRSIKADRVNVLNKLENKIRLYKLNNK